MFSKKKICVIVGLKNELNALNGSGVNFFVGYGKNGARKVTSNNLKDNDCFISFGFAGSIDQNLKNGHILIPKKIVWEDGTKNETNKKYRNFILNKIKSKKISSKNLTSVRKIVNNPFEKKKINEKYQVSAIDMESEAIQRIVVKAKKVFLVIRVILDDCQFSIPDYIINSTNEDGVLNKYELFLSIIKNPINMVSLIKLTFYYMRAIRNLNSLTEMIFKD